MPRKPRQSKKHPLSDTSEDEVPNPAPATVADPAENQDDDQDALAASALDADVADEADFRSPTSPPRFADVEQISSSNTTFAALAADSPAAIAATTSAAVAAPTSAASAAHTFTASAATSPAVSAEPSGSTDSVGRGNPVSPGQLSRNLDGITDEDVSEAAPMAT